MTKVEEFDLLEEYLHRMRHLGEMMGELKEKKKQKRGCSVGTPASHSTLNLAAMLEMASHDPPEYTDLHTRLVGASEPEYDITTAGVNLAGFS